MPSRAKQSPGVDLPPHAALPPLDVGANADEMRAFKTYAVRTGQDVYVRDSHPTRLLHHGERGFRQKPVGLYTKTQKDRVHPGLVISDARGTFMNESPETFTSTGPGAPLMDQYGNKVYGDLDLHRVDRRGARVPEAEYVPGINAQLRRFTKGSRPFGSSSTGPYGVLVSDTVQHGAHDDFPRRNDPTYKGGVVMGPQPGVTKLAARGRDEHYDTTAEYREEARRKGFEHDYTEESWDKGADRDVGARRKQNANPLIIIGLLPRVRANASRPRVEEPTPIPRPLSLFPTLNLKTLL